VKMADEIDFENGRISNFQCHVTLTLTLDRAIWHTLCITHRPLPTHQISIESEKLFVDGRTNVRTDGRTDGQTSSPALLGRLGGATINLARQLACLLAFFGSN